MLDRVRVDEYAINWKTFVEVYLEVYHVDFLHPGLGNFADCDNFHVRLRRAQLGPDRAGEERPRHARHAGLPQVAGGLPASSSRQDAQARRALGHLLTRA